MGNQNIYAAYRGDRYIGEGTVEEIAAMAGVSYATARWGISAVSRKRLRDVTGLGYVPHWATCVEQQTCKKAKTSAKASAEQKSLF